MKTPATTLPKRGTFTVPRICDAFGVSDHAVWKWVRLGAIPPEHVFRDPRTDALRIRAAGLRALLKSGRSYAAQRADVPSAYLVLADVADTALAVAQLTKTGRNKTYAN